MCLYNWLGYGNINGPVWFMGMEEGGAEIWRQKTKSLEDSLKLRSTFKPSMDFQYVWEELYSIPLESFKGANVWNYIAAFLLTLEGIEPTTETIRSYVFKDKKLGKLNSNHFICEFLPIPRKSNVAIDVYNSIWSTSNEYIKNVGSKRFDLIEKTLLENQKVKLLVSYDRKFSKKFNNHFTSKVVEKWNDPRGKEYVLYKVSISKMRDLYFLTTPFFGQGQASYQGIKVAGERVKRFGIL